MMDTLDQLGRFVQLGVSLATFITLAWGLRKMFQSASEARRTRIEALSAALRADQSARLAADHAIATSTETRAMAANVLKIELATNSMKDALVKATGEAAGLAGEQRGREQAAEARAKE